MDVKLTYFRMNGEYLSEFIYRPRKPFRFQIFQEIENHLDNRTLPGLAKGHSQCVIHVQIPDRKPHIIK